MGHLEVRANLFPALDAGKHAPQPHQRSGGMEDTRHIKKEPLCNICLTQGDMDGQRQRQRQISIDAGVQVSTMDAEQSRGRHWSTRGNTSQHAGMFLERATQLALAPMPQLAQQH